MLVRTNLGMNDDRDIPSFQLEMTQGKNLFNVVGIFGFQSGDAEYIINEYNEFMMDNGKLRLLLFLDTNFMVERDGMDLIKLFEFFLHHTSFSSINPRIFVPYSIVDKKVTKRMTEMVDYYFDNGLNHEMNPDGKRRKKIKELIQYYFNGEKHVDNFIIEDTELKERLKVSFFISKDGNISYYKVYHFDNEVKDTMEIEPDMSYIKLSDRYPFSLSDFGLIGNNLLIDFRNLNYVNVSFCLRSFIDEYNKFKSKPDDENEFFMDNIIINSELSRKIVDRYQNSNLIDFNDFKTSIFGKEALISREDFMRSINIAADLINDMIDEELQKFADDGKLNNRGVLDVRFPEHFILANRITEKANEIIRKYLYWDIDFTLTGVNPEKASEDHSNLCLFDVIISCEYPDDENPAIILHDDLKGLKFNPFQAADWLCNMVSLSIIAPTTDVVND